MHYIHLCTYIDCLQESGNAKSSFWAMFRNSFRSNGTSGQNTEYHLLFVWISSTSHKNWMSLSCLHMLIIGGMWPYRYFNLISQYMSFSYVTRPLPVKWHFRSKRHISSFVDMTFPYTYKQTERFYLVDKRRKIVSSDPTLNSSIVPPSKP
jgi:hypothetical protein